MDTDLKKELLHVGVKQQTIDILEDEEVFSCILFTHKGLVDFGAHFNFAIFIVLGDCKEHLNQISTEI